MCGQPSHIHGTLLHWAFIFKGPITGDQPFGLNKQVIVCQFHLCACAYVLTYTYICLAFKAKVLLLQTARVWHTTDPRWIQNAETENGRAHTYLWTSVMTDHRLAYSTSQVLLCSWGGGGSRNIKALIFFSFSQAE